MLRFENKGKLDDLGFEIDLNMLKSIISGSNPVSNFPSIFNMDGREYHATWIPMVLYGSMLSNVTVPILIQI
jgi:hypothetical protein